MDEGWKEIGGKKRGSSRRGRGGVDRDGNDDKWDGSESEREREQGAFERRGVVWAGSRLQIIKRIHDKWGSPDLEFFGICLLGQIPNGVHAGSLFFHLIYVAITEKYLAKHLGLLFQPMKRLSYKVSCLQACNIEVAGKTIIK